MTQNKVLFADTLKLVAEIVFRSGIDKTKTVIIRDIYGRINIAYDGERSEAINAIEGALNALGAYHAPRQQILCNKDLFNAELFFGDPTIANCQLPGMDTPIKLLDRQIVGQDWLIPPKSRNPIPRLVFYGVKGGVGRSTAISFLASHLANSGKGKKILCIDLDLESPGISSMLLPSENRNDFGLIDWFVEDGVGQGDEILHRMISASPLGENTTGSIKVAAASGSESGDDAYLPKLARLYGDIHRNGSIERFADRTKRLIESLENLEKPDIVLIDSRAGLHDLAAVSIVGLSTYSYLFASGTQQNWQDYRYLFSHWRSYPEIVGTIRNRLIMVQAMFPESDQMNRHKKFIEDAYNLFSSTLYDIIEPEMVDDINIFNFDLNDKDAPHFPVKILWHNRFQEAEPALVKQNIFSETLVSATFTDFFNRVSNDLESI